MAFPTTNATVELVAINQILASVGQAPVTTLDTTNPDVAIAMILYFKYHERYKQKAGPLTKNMIMGSPLILIMKL